MGGGWPERMAGRVGVPHCQLRVGCPCTHACMHARAGHAPHPGFHAALPFHHERKARTTGRGVSRTSSWVPRGDTHAMIMMSDEELSMCGLLDVASAGQACIARTSGLYAPIRRRRLLAQHRRVEAAQDGKVLLHVSAQHQLNHLHTARKHARLGPKRLVCAGRAE